MLQAATQVAINIVVGPLAGLIGYANDLSKLAGFDLTAFHTANLFGLTLLVLFIYGLVVLFIIYFLYKLARLNPLSGNGGGGKQGFMLLAMIGYSLPILNLFPLFIFWTLTVMKNPK